MGPLRGLTDLFEIGEIRDDLGERVAGVLQRPTPGGAQRPARGPQVGPVVVEAIQKW